MLKIRHLCAGYSGRSVLNDVSMNVDPETITVIVGPNGCGKSTLLKTIVGIVEPTSGEILVDDNPAEGRFRSMDELSGRERAQKIAYLAQSKQVPDITALRMVLHGRFPYLGYPRRYRPVDYDIARQAMRKLGVEELEDRPMNTLSGGTRQKVYIAMALAQDTPAILMDEPTTYLDVAYQLQMMDQVRILASEGKAVVMVLHDLALALEYGDRIIVMEEGKVVTSGEPEVVYASGALDRVFGVHVKRVEADGRWKYYVSS